MLAFVADNVRNAIEIFGVLGYDESRRSEVDHHSRRVNISALVIDRAGVLRGSNGNIG